MRLRLDSPKQALGSLLKRRFSLLGGLALVLLIPALAACGGNEDTLTIYSGRSENLVQPIVDQFASATGVEVKVRYGSTAQMANTILEEGRKSPADVFFAQDAGALGAVAAAGLLDTLPDSILEKVDHKYRSRNKEWVGLSGRARVVAYNTDRVSPEDLPDSILDFTDPKWRGRIGWPPLNGSFQAFVTALRLVHGEDAARQWLEGIKANGAQEYPNNRTALLGVASGEVDVAFVNHYYLHGFLRDQGEGFNARNHYTGNGDVGALVNVAGAAILKSSDNQELARRFLDFMLSQLAQRYFAEETFEYPLAAGVPPPQGLVTLEELQPPDIDLSNLQDLQGTLELLREVDLVP